MKKRAFHLFIASLLLSACSSTPIPSVSHYLLKSQGIGQENRLLELNSIEIADYINHRDIVLELEDGTFHRADFHKWSEDLKSGIARIIEPTNPTASGTRIDLKIDRFHGLQSGGLVLSGSWRVADPENSPWKAFSLESKANEPGYPSMIQSLSQIMEELRKSIISEVT
ncbi:MAG: PqiC family protein [Verrucomicrobiota bacterium]